MMKHDWFVLTKYEQVGYNAKIKKKTLFQRFVLFLIINYIGLNNSSIMKKKYKHITLTFFLI